MGGGAQRAAAGRGSGDVARRRPVVNSNVLVHHNSPCNNGLIPNAQAGAGLGGRGRGVRGACGRSALSIAAPWCATDLIRPSKPSIGDVVAGRWTQ